MSDHISTPANDSEMPLSAPAPTPDEARVVLAREREERIARCRAAIERVLAEQQCALRLIFDITADGRITGQIAVEVI
jgi:hypothetical protein